MYFLLWIGVGSIVGWLTGRLLQRGGGYGAIVDIAMGVAGAVAGGFIMHYSRFSVDTLYSTLGAVLGAGIATGLTAYLNGRKRYA